MSSLWASLVAQTVKNQPAVQETWVQSMGWEDPLEKGMTTHSSILAWRIPWTEEPGRLESMGSQRVLHDWAINTHTTPLILGLGGWTGEGTEVLLAAVTICSDFKAQEEEMCHYFSLFPFYLPWSNGARCCDLRFFKYLVLSCFFHSPSSVSSSF